MVSRINAEDLVKIIRNKDRKYYVLDARDDDRNGGNIKGSIHVPDQMETYKKLTLLSNLLQLIDDEDKDEDNVLIVVHCMESICRGPRLAMLLNNEMKLSQSNKIQVRVLHKGADNWIRKYHLDKDLVQDFNDDYWGFYSEMCSNPIIIKVQKLIDSLE